jgi:Flp pilus assembly protein TadG
MWCRFGSDTKRGLRGERGVIAVEFAIILPVLLVLVSGLIDFGHYWFIGHVMSDASREGARYATRYTGKLPTALDPTISDHVLLLAYANYASRLPETPIPTVSASGPGWTATDITTLAGKDVVVTVKATKTWWILGSLIPGFGSSKQLIVTTTMTCE